LGVLFEWYESFENWPHELNNEKQLHLFRC